MKHIYRHMPHHAYRDVVLDFRERLFYRFIWLLMIIAGVSINVLLLQQPRPHLMLIVLLVYMLLLWQLYHLHAHYPNTARYIFVGSLYGIFWASLRLYPAPWIPYFIAPILLISALMMSNGALLGIALFASAIVGIMPTEALSLQGHLLMYFVVALATTYIVVSSFDTALAWYSSMHQRADQLLQETRDRRAELVSTVKSLETAYQNQRRLQAQLIHARQQAEDARRMKERFASNVSHELRTPLSIILGFSEIMHLTPEVYGDVFFPPKLHQDIYQIHRNSKHLLAMIDDVLDLSHIEMSEFALNFETVDLNHFIEDTAQMIAHYFADTSVAFITEIAPNLPAIDIDRTRIRQVLINLLTNARRFTEMGTVRLQVYADDKHVTFIVADTGRGISGENIAHIFDEFYQVDYSLSRQHGGAGLGLAITKEFIEAHRGSIYVDSVYGAGTTFTFTLPIPRRQRTAHSTPARPAETPPEAPALLLIDRDPHTHSLLHRHLGEFTVHALDDPATLSEQIQTHQPVAIVHNRLPDDPALASRPIPIIECTLPSSQWLGHALPVSDSLAKPVKPQQIADILARHADVQKILIVDDEIGFVQLMQRSIERLERSYTVRRAYDGLQAYDTIQTDTPDLVFLDLSMPEMDGFELMTALETDQQYRDLHIILLTATRYIQSDDEWLAQIYIHKHGGFTPRETLHHLKHMLQAVQPSS